MLRDSKLTYKEAFRKQAWVFIVLVIAIFGVVVGLDVQSSKKDLVLGVLIIASSGIYAFWVIRRSTNQVTCTKCNENIYELVQISKAAHLNLNYCPSCGEPIDT